MNFMKEDVFKGSLKERERNYVRSRKKGEGRLLNYCFMKVFVIGSKEV